MIDFTLLPDEPLDLPARPTRGVATGLHPLAAVPQTRGPYPTPAYALCGLW